ncbi:DUF5605 domain-containing protein [Arthrobacter sp. D3-16]
MFDRESTFGETIDSPSGRAVLERFLPGLAASPMVPQLRDVRLGQLIPMIPGLEESEIRDQLWAALADLSDGVESRKPYAPAIAPDPAYEGDDVPAASARLTLPAPTPTWGVVEVRLDGPNHGNPFVDVELDAVFYSPGGDRTVRVGGFYDDGGIYLLRLLADEEGEWTFQTRSTARSLDGISGTVEVVAPLDGAHGPVRVDGFHFRHADGTRFRPLGTTAYAWTHQPAELQEQTLETLARSPFNKLRMCVFPKSYLYNTNEPAEFPFSGSLADGFDLQRFDARYFRHLERQIAQLGELGIQADLILFHAYDRWGFTDLGPAVDERYLRYVVRRLAAYANIWFSMANEYDLLWSKSEDDWERLAAVVAAEDPHGHLNSIHNARSFYDYTRPWITHCSVQRVDLYRTAENTDEWRARWGKPIVIDECGYEGDIDQGWGNLTAEELIRRFWEGAIRGGYVGHGETYLNDREELWWSKGGVLTGTSPDRIAFLGRILSEAPDGVLDPLPSDWDLPWGGTSDQHLIGYFGFSRPRFRNLVLPSGGVFEVDVIDTWNMSVSTLPGTHADTVRVELPAKQFMAIRLRRIEASGGAEGAGM